MAELKNNSKIINIDNGEIWLPEVVIQHIQSFMSEKESARTSILSKSWHTAWSTRPNLNFSQRDFGRYFKSYGDVKRFLESVRKTMQRYEQSNLRIKSFIISVNRRGRENCMILDELIARALKLGATKLSVSVYIYLGGPYILTTNAWDLRNIKFLHLEQLNIDPLFSYHSSCEFPSLKVLTIEQCLSEKRNIRISGPSLERISFFVLTDISSLALDVPNIRKFTFLGGSRLPSLSFEAIVASMDWVSDLSIVFSEMDFKTSWFLELEKFLDELSQSKISLNLEIDSAPKVVYDYARDNQCLSYPAVVEKLTLKLSGQYINGDNNILEYLFRSVEPKLITQSWEDLQLRDWIWERNGDKFLEFFCKALNKSSVEEVNVECFEETREEWRPLSLKTLLDASTSLDDKQEIRFRLKWRVL